MKKKVIKKKPVQQQFDPKEMKMGMKVELEHKDITKGNKKLTAKIVKAHLKEKKDYYTRLKKVEGK